MAVWYEMKHIVNMPGICGGRKKGNIENTLLWNHVQFIFLKKMHVLPNLLALCLVMAVLHRTILRFLLIQKQTQGTFHLYRSCSMNFLVLRRVCTAKKPLLLLMWLYIGKYWYCFV